MNFSAKVFFHFRVELFLWFVLLSQSIRGVTFSQLIQDKICKIQHLQNDTFCRNLSELGDHDVGSDIKSSILVSTSHFNLYYQTLAFLPSIIACLFLGSWCDKYKPGRKILLIISSVGITLETTILAYMAYDFKLDYWYLLAGAVPAALGGGLSTVFIAVYSYIPASTPPDLSTIRFMFAEMIIWLSAPVGTFAGGYLLNYNIEHPIGGNGQLLNYELVFITSGVSTIIAFFLAIFFVNEKRDRLNLEKYSNDPETIYKQIQRAQKRRSPVRPLARIIEEGKGNPCKLLFSCGNFKDVVKTLTKPRSNKARLQLWLIIISFVFVLFAYMAPIYVMFPFAEEVYSWDSNKFSTYNSVSSILNSIGILITTLILVKMFKMNDIPLAICGISTFMLSSIVRASFLNLWGFWFSAVIGRLGGMGLIGIRSYLSKIIGKDELGKVFGLMSAIEGSIPLVGNPFFTMVFTVTLDTFAGAVFDASAGLLLIPLFVLMFIDVFCKHSFDKIDRKMSRHSENNRDDQQNGNQLTYRTRKAGRALRHVSTEI